MKVEIIADFTEARDAVIEIDYPKKVQVVIDYYIPDYLTPIPNDTVRFFVTIQPERYYNNYIINHQDYFDYLLTTDPELLSLSKARLMLGFPAWVKPEVEEKEFSVSTVISARFGLPGHALRKELWARRDEINIPKKFYLSTRHKINVDYSKHFILDGDHFDKNRTMKSMFHIAIDSVNRDNFFSEKLIDPLITKTVPIFWGCPNLSEFFNMEGIMKVDTVDDIINVCNSLTEEDYRCREKAIEENYLKAIELSDYGKCIKKTINNILNGRE